MRNVRNGRPWFFLLCYLEWLNLNGCNNLLKNVVNGHSPHLKCNMKVGLLSKRSFEAMYFIAITKVYYAGGQLDIFQDHTIWRPCWCHDVDRGQCYSSADSDTDLWSRVWYWSRIELFSNSLSYSLCRNVREVTFTPGKPASCLAEFGRLACLRGGGESGSHVVTKGHRSGFTSTRNQ